MKHIFVAAVFVVLFFGIGQVRFWEEDNRLFTHVNVRNDNSFDIDDVSLQVTVLGPEFDFQVDAWDEIESRSGESAIFVHETAAYDDVWVRFKVTGEDGREHTRHRLITII